MSGQSYFESMKKWKYFEDILCLVILFLICNIWSSQIYHYIQEPDRWDDLGQVYRGIVATFDSFFSLTDSPLVPLWMKFISFFSSSRLETYYLSMRVVSTLLPISLYCLSRSLKLSPFSSATAACLLCFFPLLTVGSRQVTHIAALIFITGSAIAFLFKDRSVQISILGFTSFLTALIRAEFLIVSHLLSFVLVVMIIWMIFKEPRKLLSLKIMILLPLILQVLYFLHMHGVSKERSISVFRDFTYWRHMDYGYKGNKTDLFQKLYGDYDKFKGAGLLQLPFANPNDFIDHLQYSAKSLLTHLEWCLEGMTYLFQSFFSLFLAAGYFLSLYFFGPQKKKQSFNRDVFIPLYLVTLPTVTTGVIFGVNPRYLVSLVAMLFLVISYLTDWIRFTRPLASVVLLGTVLTGSLFALPDFDNYPGIKKLYGPSIYCCSEPRGTKEIIEAFNKIPFTNLSVETANNVFMMVPNVELNFVTQNGRSFLSASVERQLTVADYMNFNHRDILVLDSDFLMELREFKVTDDPFAQDILRIWKKEEDEHLHVVRINCFNTFLVFPKTLSIANDIIQSFPKQSCPEESKELSEVER